MHPRDKRMATYTSNGGKKKPSSSDDDEDNKKTGYVFNLENNPDLSEDTTDEDVPTSVSKIKKALKPKQELKKDEGNQEGAVGGEHVAVSIEEQAFL